MKTQLETETRVITESVWHADCAEVAVYSCGDSKDIRGFHWADGVVHKSEAMPTVEAAIAFCLAGI